MKDKCRCVPCTEANRREQARPKPARTTSTAELRAYLEDLNASGAPLKLIAETYQVPLTWIRGVLYGRGKSTKIKRRRTNVEYAQRLKNSPVSSAAIRLTRTPTDFGIQRRIQALISIGWTQTLIAENTKLSQGTILRALNGGSTTTNTKLRIVQFYNVAWKRPLQGQYAEAARRRARERGWRSPLHWDDEDLDEPEISGSVTAVENPKQMRAAEIDFLLDAGQTQEQISATLGLTRRGLLTWLRRNQLDALTRRFKQAQ